MRAQRHASRPCLALCLAAGGKSFPGNITHTKNPAQEMTLGGLKGHHAVSGKDKESFSAMS